MQIINDVVELTCDCELGRQGERAVVTAIDERRYMTLVFFERERTKRVVHTGADYLYLKRVS